MPSRLKEYFKTTPYLEYIWWLPPIIIGVFLALGVSHLHRLVQKVEASREPENVLPESQQTVIIVGNYVWVHIKEELKTDLCASARSTHRLVKYVDDDPNKAEEVSIPFVGSAPLIVHPGKINEWVRYYVPDVPKGVVWFYTYDVYTGCGALGFLNAERPLTGKPISIIRGDSPPASFPGGPPNG